MWGTAAKTKSCTFLCVFTNCLWVNQLLLWKQEILTIGKTHYFLFQSNCCVCLRQRQAPAAQLKISSREQRVQGRKAQHSKQQQKQWEATPALPAHGLSFAMNQPVSDAMWAAVDISHDLTPAHGEGSTCLPLCEKEETLWHQARGMRVTMLFRPRRPWLVDFKKHS